MMHETHEEKTKLPEMNHSMTKHFRKIYENFFAFSR